jgi:alkylhydroperoxidase family enzyme
MSRLPMLPARPEGVELESILAELRAIRGPDFELPNLYRILSISPPMFRAWIDFAWPLRLKAKSDRLLRELLILRAAQVCKVRYEWAHHVPMALEAGVTVDQLRGLELWREAACFDPKERGVIRLAEEVAVGPGASEEAVADLRALGFPDDQVVELVLTASFYICVARFLASMDVELEPGYERYLDDGACRLPGGFESSERGL